MEQISKTQRIAGLVMGGLFVAFMIMDSGMKFLKVPEVIEATVNDLCYQEHHIVIIGILSLVGLILYLIPQTSIFGAVFLTGFFGGAIATNFRLDKPLFSHVVFPVYLAILMWGSLWLRNTKLRSLFPIIK